jgi:hypothetical protein
MYQFFLSRFASINNIAGDANLAFSGAGSLLGNGALSANVSITFSNSVVLLGSGSLLGESDLAFSSIIP